MVGFLAMVLCRLEHRDSLVAYRQQRQERQQAPVPSAALASAESATAQPLAPASPSPAIHVDNKALEPAPQLVAKRRCPPLLANMHVVPRWLNVGGVGLNGVQNGQ